MLLGSGFAWRVSDGRSKLGRLGGLLCCELGVTGRTMSMEQDGLVDLFGILSLSGGGDVNPRRSRVGFVGFALFLHDSDHEGDY